MSELNKDSVKYGLEFGFDLVFMFFSTTFLMKATFIAGWAIYYLGFGEVGSKEVGDKSEHLLKALINIISVSLTAYFKILMFPLKVIMCFLEIIGLAVFLKAHLNGRTFGEELELMKNS